jgi:signal peptidase I
MSANQVFLVLAAVLFLSTLVLTPAALKWGLKLTGIAEISLLRAFGLFLVITVAAIVVSILVSIVVYLSGLQLSNMRLNVLAYLEQFIASCLVVAVVYKRRIGIAALAITPFFLLAAGQLLFAFGIRACAYESFVIPTNSMAPTLLGNHWEAPCPKCGEPAYGSPAEAEFSFPPNGVSMVCSKELTTVYVKTPPKRSGGGDRILVCKFLKPRRWDLVVFRLPSDPTVTYLKRLVGLPGEKVEIRDGAVWINGERMEPPDSIRGIHYTPTIEGRGQTVSGPGSHPVTLGDDEYFVLGDFVSAAFDSRLWTEGAKGHPPYAVPESNILGTVINIYWPMSRWRSFR